MLKWSVGAIVVAVCLGACATPAYAQNAQITGVVKDSSGGVIPGATITAKNVDNGFTRAAVSEAGGEYRLVSLPPGPYTVTTELQGFSSETRPDIVLVIDQTAIINFNLKPATVSETVTVTGESPIVDVTRSDVSTSVSSQQIQDLPVASRRWVDLAMLTPGTSQDNIRGQFYRGNVNIGGGTREYSNMFYVDGVNNTWAEMGEPRQNFAMDAIQEFKVSTSGYKAEYGLATGGVLTVVTKSGSNLFKGSGLFFLRDKSITAEEYFQKQNDIVKNLPEGTSKPDYRRYQDGFTFGGPIVKDKTHFFFAFERTDEDQFFTVNANNLFPQYEGIVTSKQYRWTYNLRVDHQLSSKQSLFVRWGAESEYRPVVTAGGRTAASASFDFAVPRQSAVVGHTTVLNERALNDFRFQYAYSKYEVAPPYSHLDAAPGDFDSRLPFCTPVFTYPSITIGGCGNAQMGPEHRVQLKDDFSYLMRRWGGKHQWKVGFDYSNIPFEGDLTNSPLGSWTLPKDAVYNAADPTTYPTQYTQSLPTYANIPVSTYAAYLQDDYQVAPNLIINIGVRYDRQIGSYNEDLPDLLGKIQDKLGRNGTFPLDVSVVQPPGTRGDRNNFGPRVGFAWDPGTNGVTNIHAAWGLFYDNMRTLQNFNELTWPQAQQIIINRPSFPDPLQGQSRSSFVSTAPPNITVEDNNVVSPYAHQFNAGVTRSLTNTLAVTADVTLTYRYSDRDTVDLNLPDQVTRVKKFPQFARVNFWESTRDNTYKALLVKVDKRMSRNLQFLASYTLSKAEDIGFSNNLGDRYGFFKIKQPGQADRRHRLVTSGIFRLPADTQVSVIADFRSSLPFNPTSALDLNNDGYTIDLPAGVTPWSGCRDLNVDALNAFRTARGLSAVSQIDCPTWANVDIRMSKFFQVSRSHRIEVLAQLFNVFNRANFDVSQGSITLGNDAVTGRPLFGTVNRIVQYINAPSRQAEFAVRYQF
jgi:outer membrane receptor protein involved in Fe transport